jgi:hypothetical protein
MTDGVRVHRGVDYDVSGKPITNDLITGAIYEVVFGCVDEQRQVRGGIENYGDRVVNSRKVDDLFANFKALLGEFFEGKDGLVLHSTYVLGGEYGFKEHYIHYKIEVRQTMRSMWDFSAEPLIEDFIAMVSSGNEFKHLITNFTDRTQTIMDALEYGKRN